MERGAEFQTDAQKHIHPLAGRSSSLAWEALGDVVEWLGFEDTERYFEALGTERERIFERAREDGEGEKGEANAAV